MTDATPPQGPQFQPDPTNERNLTVPTPRDELHAQVVLDGIERTSQMLGLTGPTYDGRPILTIGKFDQARDVVQEWFKRVAPGHDWPTPYKPGHEGPMWVLSLEGADDWAVRICADESVTWPDGVFAEPVAGWCLGLYPA